MFSPTYISALVIVLVSIFNLFKINITQQDLEPIITSAIVIISGVIVLIRRFNHGGVNLVGQVKK